MLYIEWFWTMNSACYPERMAYLLICQYCTFQLKLILKVDIWFLIMSFLASDPSIFFLSLSFNIVRIKLVIYRSIKTQKFESRKNFFFRRRETLFWMAKPKPPPLFFFGGGSFILSAAWSARYWWNPLFSGAHQSTYNLLVPRRPTSMLITVLYRAFRSGRDNFTWKV